MPYSITRANAARDLEALRAVIAKDGIVVGDFDTLRELADSIEEQVKPEEPKKWGSIVFGRTCGVDPCHWQRDADGNWRSEHGALAEHWSHFRPGVEVRRVGVGLEPLAEWESDLLNLQHRREVAADVLRAMDVDQYLIDAVVNATQTNGCKP